MAGGYNQAKGGSRVREHATRSTKQSSKQNQHKGNAAAPGSTTEGRSHMLSHKNTTPQARDPRRYDDLLEKVVEHFWKQVGPVQHNKDHHKTSDKANSHDTNWRQNNDDLYEDMTVLDPIRQKKNHFQAHKMTKGQPTWSPYRKGDKPRKKEESSIKAKRFAAPPLDKDPSRCPEAVDSEEAERYLAPPATHELVLDSAIDKAVERFHDEKTMKLIKDEYEVLNIEIPSAEDDEDDFELV